MTKDDAAENRLLDPLMRPSEEAAAQEMELRSSPPLENHPALADLLERAIRSGTLPERARLAAELSAVSPGVSDQNLLHERLLEELTAAKEQMQAEPAVEDYEKPAAYGETLAPPPAFHEPDPQSFDYGEHEPASLPQSIPQAATEGMAPDAPETEPSIAEPLEDYLMRSRSAPHGRAAPPASRAKAKGRKPRSLLRRMRIGDWNRRRLALISLIHRHVFDRETEELLFCKAAPLHVYRVEETEEGLQKSFLYQGPIPKKLLDWALSALPRDLNRYAFVDFRAGNGRTLLLAARRNFEYAAGYAFDAESAETLEMNLAHYPRSRLACRDVRALRGDRDGVVIPSQPAVLFFPDALCASHLEIILTYVTASLRLEPRPFYLIFENSGRERGMEPMGLFERAPLPVLSGAKALLFSPVSVAVYRARIDIAHETEPQHGEHDGRSAG